MTASKPNYKLGGAGSPDMGVHEPKRSSRHRTQRHQHDQAPAEHREP
jgi:hypothetical protein